MENGIRYGYARVSSVGQDLEGQVKALKDAGAEQVYSEKMTGTTKERPKFQEVLEVLQEGDTLIVTKLDRFARSATDGVTLIKELLERGVRVHVLNMGVVEDTAVGRLLLTVMAGFAEFERDMIVERMQEGKALARQREGYREGRPKKFGKEQRLHAMRLLDEGYTYAEVERVTGMSRSTLARERRKYVSNNDR